MDITAAAENGDAAVSDEELMEGLLRAQYPDRYPETTSGQSTDDPKSTTEPSAPPPVESELDRLEKLIAQAERGDATALAAVTKFFAEGGNVAWREAGNLADVAEKLLATTLFPDSKGRSLCVGRYVRELRDKLVDNDVSPLEKLAIDRVSLAWTFACAVDALVAGSGSGMASTALVRAQEAAEKRFQGALKSLQLAREICRGAAGRPLRIFGSRPARDQAVPQRAAV